MTRDSTTCRIPYIVELIASCGEESYDDLVTGTLQAITLIRQPLLALVLDAEVGRRCSIHAAVLLITSRSEKSLRFPRLSVSGEALVE